MTEKRSDKERILILGAAGRDFHDFNVFFRRDPRYEVVGFTASQIPHIACRQYPPSLAGELYPLGLPIWPEEDLVSIIRDYLIDRCILAYSDLSHQKVMDLASKVQAEGADFAMLGGLHTMLESSKPVIAICAVRTGSGKSQTSRYIADLIRKAGLRPVVVRHPMPYGKLEDEAVQRFASLADLDAAGVTIEEREEYESHIKKGTAVYAGVDYEPILRLAEKESDIIIWDGGNNDTPFFKPDLWITIADPLRPGDEMTYYPGETNFRAADVIVINKANVATKEAVDSIKANASRINPGAVVINAASEVTAEDPEVIRGKRVLVIEDGPTLTHGGMSYGAGKVAAEKYGASELIDPRPFAVGSIKEIFEKFGHISNVLPAMGYYPQQIEELRETINNADCDSVIIATPVDLRRLMEIDKPATAVFYELAEMGVPRLRDEIARFISSVKSRDMTIT
ncbi:MAG TPA: cyclic 2,3-diphosphoglycerate synthase [Methanotrichaceae archaeon]|nr:cyclic 2,3-diphosphoglycerate synthase [Methanotrichaceae archaeon]